MHVGFAHFGGSHWLLNDDDAKAYALAVNNVARHYDIAVAQRTIDVVNLIGMVAWIEGTRFLVSRHGPPKQPQQPRGQVVPFMQFSSPVTGQVHPTTVVPPTTPAPEPFGPPLPTGTDTPEGGALH